MVNTELMQMLGGGGMQSPGQLTTGNVGAGTDWGTLLPILFGGAAERMTAPYAKSDPWAAITGAIGGTASQFGQSKKLSQIAAKQSAQRRKDFELFREIMGGGTTPAGVEGPTGFSLKPGKEGLPELTMGMTLGEEGYKNLFGDVGMPTVGGMTHKQIMKGGGLAGIGSLPPSPTKKLPDISSLSLSPTGISAADLVGLTPEQILSVMGEQQEADRLRTGTFMNAMKLLGQMAPEPTEPTDQFETLTDEKGRIFSRNVLTKELRQVSGVPPEKPLTFEERAKLKKIPADRPYGDWWRNPETNRSVWVESRDDPPAGYTQRVPSREQVVSDLPERKFGFTKEKSAADSAQLIMEHSKNEAVKPEIEFYNKNAPGTIGYFWRTEKGWLWDTNEATEVQLPLLGGRQLTMTDVRKDAAERGISPEAVLKEIWEWQQEQEK